MTQRNYDDLLQRIERIAERNESVSVETIGRVHHNGREYPLLIVHLGDKGRLGVTLSAGIHGDEPAGVEAALKFIEMNAGNDRLLSNFNFLIFPCDNPSGWEMNTRENANGVDLNREFAAKHPAEEVDLIMKSLQGKCFDIVIEMHEDVDSPGFYMYELSNSRANYVGEKIIKSVAQLGYPINENPCIEDMKARRGLIRRRSPRFRKTHLPKAVYTYRVCGGHVVTFEPPASKLPLEDRVKIELLGLKIFLESAAGESDLMEI